MINKYYPFSCIGSQHLAPRYQIPPILNKSSSQYLSTSLYRSSVGALYDSAFCWLSLPSHDAHRRPCSSSDGHTKTVRGCLVKLPTAGRPIRGRCLQALSASSTTDWLPLSTFLCFGPTDHTHHPSGKYIVSHR